MKKENSKIKKTEITKKQAIISTSNIQNILNNLQFPNNRELRLLFKILNNSLQENEKLLQERNFIDNKIIQEYNNLNKFNEEINIIKDNILKIKAEIESKYNYQEKLDDINASLGNIVDKLKKLNLNEIFMKRKRISLITKEKRIAETKDDLEEITDKFETNKKQFSIEFEQFYEKIKTFPTIKIDFEGFEKFFNRFNFLNTEARNLKIKINNDNLLLATCDQKILKLRKKIENEVEDWMSEIKREMMIEISSDLNTNFKSKIRDLKISQL